MMPYPTLKTKQIQQILIAAEVSDPDGAPRKISRYVGLPGPSLQ